MVQLITDNIAAFHRGNARARCEQIFACQIDDPQPWLWAEAHLFLMDLLAHHPEYAAVASSHEVMGSTTATFLHTDCFVVRYYNGDELMVDHLKCIDVMFD